MSAPTKIDWSKVDHPAPVFQAFPSRRSVVYGTRGIVSSSQPLATAAGLEILNKGGNAADAAVATSVALNVTEPCSCGIGGDAFCLYFDATTKKITALNGSGRAPKRLDVEYLRQNGVEGNSIPLTNLNSVTVPGAAAAWIDTIEHLGSGKVTVAEIFEPAIRLAEKGFPVSEISSEGWQHSEGLIKSASPNGDEMLLNGRAPQPGQIMRLENLAKTFKELVAHGKDGFYKGRIAQAIVDLVQSKGGVMDLEDLASHTSTFVEPIHYTYAGEVTVYECPPNGQGLTALLALGILEQMQEQGTTQPLLDLPHNSPEYLHALIEALRLAFGDSQCGRIAQQGKSKHPARYWFNLTLSMQKYLAERAKLFDPKKTNPEVVHGSPENSSDTVYFTVTDQWGNACSYIQSNYAGFGTGAIPEGCGFTLQNRGSNFTLLQDHPNVVQGGKRPYHTIIPAMATRNGELFLSYGVMGGFMQPQGHVQVLLNILRGYTVQAALDAPRFCISPGMPGAANSGAAGDANSEIYFEDGIPAQTVEHLRAMGHDVRLVTGAARGMLGRGQIIQKLRDVSGQLSWAAGSDPRADGHAAPQI
ncbi:hypothetical protein D9611_005794 [Ephemerocybe angulata]|uniref:Gamma-glutamyltranspeptidase n=1 Tax=Ephemerocybe angulata TaxID=980116 RepID=A0A8H5BHU3_9AGAR|nr:hypothetical protein D9611_005794 [Tulosesus angulatus]